jgi:multidrug efflux pump subunit AcrA (membrane-fusion protein)
VFPSGSQRILITAGVLIAAAAIFEAQQASKFSAQVQALQQQLSGQTAQAAKQRDDATDQLAALQSENQQLRARNAAIEDAAHQLREIKARDAAVAHDPTQATLISWLGRVNRLKQRLQTSPGQQIPEMQYLTDHDWLSATQDKLDNDDDFRHALSVLRYDAESAFQKMLSYALSAYAKANNNQFPTDVSQLQPFFSSPVDNSILQRWEVSSGPGGHPAITQIAPVDATYDTRFWVNSNGVSTETGSPNVWQSGHP